MKIVQELRILDTEFAEIQERFLQETVNDEAPQLEDGTRYLAVLAALTGCRGLDTFSDAFAGGA